VPGGASKWEFVSTAGVQYTLNKGMGSVHSTSLFNPCKRLGIASPMQGHKVGLRFTAGYLIKIKIKIGSFTSRTLDYERRTLEHPASLRVRQGASTQVCTLS